MYLFNLPQTLVLLAVISLSACSTNSDSVPVNQAPAISGGALAPTLVLKDVLTPISQNSTIEYLRVKHHLVECEGFQVTHCLLIQKEDRDEWFYFNDQIDGFEYQWGTDYEILVEVQQIASGLPESSNKQYSLLEVITATPHKTGEAFAYTARQMHERITEIAPGQFSMLGNKVFTCTEENCGIIRSAIAQKHSALLSFQHNANPTMPLVLESVLCVDAASTFNVSCS